jgi:LCP family protein required for cell wall assembly
VEPGEPRRSAGRATATGVGEGRPPRRSADPRQVVVGGPAADPRRPGRDGPGRSGPERPRHARGGGFGGGPDDPYGPGGDDDLDEGAPRRKRTWPQRTILGVGLALIVVCMLGASVAGYTLVKYNSIDRDDNLDGLPSAAKGEPENYLIVAIDTREGHGSVNTDTIMVLRVDPKADSLALTSFPRDLMVEVADTGKTGQINAVYNRPDGTGAENLVNTLRQNYGIVINHFIALDFVGFEQMVDSVGGVSMWFESAARDTHSGFYSEDLGCVTLDGERGLQFVRSRYLDIMTDDGWERDPKSDEHRVQRQQIFIQRAMSKVLADVKSNPLRLRELVDIGTSNVTLDPNLTIGDILDLADQFKGFDAGKLESFPLPTEPYPQDPNRLVLIEPDAEPMLNVFRGLPPGEIGPGLIEVQVLNGTHADPAQEIANLATDVSGALQQVGFDMAQPDDVLDTFYAQTTIQYAPGQAMYAQRVARHISSAAAIPTEEVADLQPGQVRVIAGADFTTVHEQAMPIESMPAPAGAAAPADTAAAPDAGAETAPAEAEATPAETPPAPEEEANPFIIGAAPENASC